MKLNQAKLGIGGGLPQCRLSRIESGRARVTVDEFSALANAIQLRESHLIELVNLVCAIATTALLSARPDLREQDDPISAAVRILGEGAVIELMRFAASCALWAPGR